MGRFRYISVQGSLIGGSKKIIGSWFLSFKKPVFLPISLYLVPWSNCIIAAEMVNLKEKKWEWRWREHAYIRAMKTIVKWIRERLIQTKQKSSLYIFSRAFLLEENNYLEDAFKVYERRMGFIMFIMSRHYVHNVLSQILERVWIYSSMMLQW